MKCEEVVERLWSYFEGKLPTDERKELDDHAAGCASCGPLLKKCAELTCRDFTEFLHDYVEDRLPPERKRIFERHLTVCEDCVAYLDAYRRTADAARAAHGTEFEDVPPDLMRAVLESFDETED